MHQLNPSRWGHMLNVSLSHSRVLEVPWNSCTHSFFLLPNRGQGVPQKTQGSATWFSPVKRREGKYDLWFTLEGLQSLFPKLTASKISTPEHKRSSNWACAGMPKANNKPKIKCPDFHVMNYLWLLLLPLSHGLTSRVTPPVFVCCLICLAIKRKEAFTNN